MRFGVERRASAEINLTPLIDILFLVLVFLVVTASFTDRTVLSISLPEAGTADRLATPRDAVTVVVDAGGTLYLDGVPMEAEDVRRELGLLPDPGGITLTVAADERTPHGRVVQVLDLARGAGILRLDIQTVRDPAGPSAAGPTP
jgi:biopolymer transport protein ExbD